MLRFAMLGISVLVSISLVFAQNDESRTPTPAKDAIATAEKKLKEVFKADFAKTKAADRSELAGKLLDFAAQSKDDPAEKYVLLQEARDLAAKAGDHALYLRAADELSTAFRVSAADARAGSVETLAANLPLAGAREGAQTLIDAVDSALGSGDFDAAQKLLKGAEIAARKASVPALASAVSARTKSVASLRKEYEKLSEAQKTLETKPTDGPANLLVGRFLCFVKNDWDAGVPRLVLGSDAALRDSAEKDAKAGSGAANDKVDAGDAWYKIGSDLDPLQKGNLQNRALRWYREALPDLTGLAKVKVDKRVEELAKTAPAAAIEQVAKWPLIRNAIKAQQVKEWPTVGGAFHKTPFTEVPAKGGILIGFRFSVSATTGRFTGILQAVYKGENGEFYGAFAGKANVRDRLLVTKAKAGYAVGSIYTRGGGGFDAVQPIFMKMTQTGLDPTDSYKGTYIGGDGGSEATYGGDGNYIVGIHGKVNTSNGHVAALSIVTLTNVEGLGTPKTKKKF
jgi:hypothetical protein